MEERWIREITLNSKLIEVEFTRRAFREGLEVNFNIDGENIVWGEQGFGEENILNRIIDTFSKKGDLS